MSSDQMIGSGRPMRVCTPVHNDMEIGCGVVDDHPRHVIDTGGDEEIQFHLDCHADAGCVSCRAQVADRPDGATGQEMLDHLMANAPADTNEQAAVAAGEG